MPEAPYNRLHCSCCHRLKRKLEKCDDAYFIPFFLRPEAIGRRQNSEDYDTNLSFHEKGNNNDFVNNSPHTGEDEPHRGGELELHDFHAESKSDEIFA